MSEESAPAPSQGIGAWIVSGSVALVLVIGVAVAFHSPDKSTEEGNPTSNQTVAPGGGHTTGPTRDTAAPPATDPTQVQEAAGVLGVQLTMPGTTGRDLGATAGRAPGGQPTRSSPRPAGTPSGNLAPEVGRPSAPTRPTLTVDELVPIGQSSEESVQVIETLEAPDQSPAPFEPNPEAEVRRGVPVPSEPGTYSLTWQENGQEFSAHVDVSKDGRVTIIDAEGSPDRYRYDPATGRLTATVTPGTGTDQDNENDRNAETGAPDQVSADTGNSQIPSVQSAFPATTPLATVESTRPPAPAGLPEERTQPHSTETSVTPTRAMGTLPTDIETARSRVEGTEAKQRRGVVTETQQTEVEVFETKQPRSDVNRTWSTRSQAPSQPQANRTARRSANATPDAGGATPTTSTAYAPGA